MEKILKLYEDLTKQSAKADCKTQKYSQKEHMISNAISKTSVVYNTSRIILFELNHQGFLFTSWFSYWSNTPCCLTVPSQDPGSEVNTTEEETCVKYVITIHYPDPEAAWCRWRWPRRCRTTSCPPTCAATSTPWTAGTGCSATSGGSAEDVLKLSWLLGDFWFIIYATQIYRIVNNKTPKNWLLD